jgi:hypothetical protein
MTLLSLTLSTCHAGHVVDFERDRNDGRTELLEATAIRRIHHSARGSHLSRSNRSNVTHFQSRPPVA